MIYMDNSATSYPKPQKVIDSVVESFENAPANPGRSSHREAVRSAHALYCARQKVAEFVNTVPENVIFTYNATYALNMAILGTVKRNGKAKKIHVVTTAFEHNSVLRPLYRLEREKEIEISFLSGSDENIICDFEKMLYSERKPDFLIITHTSNVTGARMPVEALGKLCRKGKVAFILDASQALGYNRVDMKKDGVDILCSSGHKGLYGIMGSGFMAIAEDSLKIPSPVITGGSGIMSFEKDMPEFLPERLEAGTVGMTGIESIRAGIEYIEEVSCEYIEEYCKAMRSRILEGLSVIPKVKVYNPDCNAVSIVAFNIGDVKCDKSAQMLDRAGICCRSGYHCAPLMHDFLKTNGTLRLSLSHFNTFDECERVLIEIEKIANNIM